MICERVRVVCDIVPSVFSSVGSSTVPGGRYACMSVSVCCSVCLWFHCCMKRSIRVRLREVLYWIYGGCVHVVVGLSCLS